MSVIKIRRLEESQTEILSVIMADDRIVGFGLELPNLDNQKNISCIPAGVYPYFKYASPRLRQTVLQLHNVPNRTDIQIHVGNTFSDISGCILVGKSVGYLKGVRAVLSSTKAMKELLDLVEYTGVVYIFNGYSAT